MDDVNNAQVIADLAVAATEIKTADFGTPFVVVPEGYQVKDLETLLPNPRHKRGTFVAQEVLAKHDENYMPPDMASEMKKAGWRPEMGAPPAAALWNRPKTSDNTPATETKAGG